MRVSKFDIGPNSERQQRYHHQKEEKKKKKGKGKKGSRAARAQTLYEGPGHAAEIQSRSLDTKKKEGERGAATAQ